jgi:integrase
LVGNFGRITHQTLTKINTRKMKAYVEHRQEAGVSNATINRELASLSKMFSVARANDMPVHMPVIPRLKEADARKGFFSHAQYLRVLDALPEPYKPVLTFGYLTGWRKNEILNLTWERVSLAEGTVRLEAGETKNEGARNLTLEPELQTLLEGLWSERDRKCPYVFQNDGKKIGGNQGDFNKVWQNACKKAKVNGKLFHDLRRTAVRNMVRAGISEKVAMTISGHKTRSVFERYNIVDDQDLRVAAKKRAAYQEKQMAELAAAEKLRIGEVTVVGKNPVATTVEPVLN